jgi:hypothetical protein
MKCYKCGAELPASGSRCPECGQAIYTRMGTAGVAKGRRLDGCLHVAPSPRDFRAEPNVTTLPRRVDLRSGCSAVEDQGQLGSCTANATVGAVEFLERAKGKPSIDLSRLFVYFNSRRAAGRVEADCGASIAGAMAALLAFGAPPEDEWPYDPERFTVEPDAGVYARALKHQPAEYARVDGLEAVKGALARQHPVVFGIDLPSRCYEEAGRNGKMPSVTAGDVEAARQGGGGHSMLFVGYDMDEGTLLVRNSWGATWGDHGYCRMPFDVFEVGTGPGDTWIAGQLEASGAFSLVRPTPAVAPPTGGVKDMAAKMREEIRTGLTKDLNESFKDIKNRVNPPRR